MEYHPATRDSTTVRRRRRTFLLTAIAGIAVVTMAIVWASTSSSDSSSSSSASASSSSSPSSSKTKSSTTSSTNPARRQSIVVLGDSATQYGGYQQGWEVLLHGEYVRELDTFNRGLSGYNTRVFLQYAVPGIVEELTSYYKAAVVIVWFGMNDATLADGPNKAQHVPLDEYKENLVEIIHQLRTASPDTKVLLLSPSYIDEKQRRAAMVNNGRTPTDPLDRNNAETIKYAHACTEIMNSTFKNDTHVAYIDVYNYFLSNYPTDENKTNILKDGLHFTSTGDRIFFELVNDKIKTIVPTSVLTTWQFPNDNVLIHY